MLTRSILCVALLLVLGTTVQAGQAQTVQGVVRDDATGDPLLGAAVRLLDPDDTVLSEILSDANGRFAVGLPAPGTYRLEITLIGYAPGRSDLFTVGSGDEPSVEIYLIVQPVRMDSLEVVGEPRNPRLEMVGFYQRVAQDYGHFMLREEIERRSARQVTDLFYGFQGGRVVSVNNLAGEFDVVLRGGSTMFLGEICFPTVVLDGVVVRNGGPVDYRTAEGRRQAEIMGRDLGQWNALVHPAEIDAIEVYPSAMGLPVQYAGHRSPCGAILIWTRR